MVIADAVDPSWALPLNTLLLVVLAVVNAHVARTQLKERREIGDVKRKLGVYRRASDLGRPRFPDTGERRRATDR
jgi:hypothetical protein